MPKLRAILLALRVALGLCPCLTAVYVATDVRFVIGFSNWSYDQDTYAAGWPVVCYQCRVYEPFVSVANESADRFEHRKYHPEFIAVNLIALAAICGSSLYVALRWRPATAVPRFSVAHMLISMAAAAVVAFILRHEVDPLAKAVAMISSAPGRYYPLTAYPWWIFAPVLWGIACVVIVACLLAGAGVRTAGRLVATRGRVGDQETEWT